MTLCVSVSMDSGFSEYGNDSACYGVSDVREGLGSNPDSDFSEFGNDSTCYGVSDVREGLGSNPGDTVVYCTT